MKVIFLDIDGVLNSYAYFNAQEEFQAGMDEKNLRVLKDIVDATQAKIVLSSSWRHGWEPKFEDCGVEEQGMVRQFEAFGLCVMDKTGVDTKYHRENEVYQWMKDCKKPIEGYVILDDGPFHWEKRGLEEHVVKTSFDEGGLLECHRQRAIDILNQPPGFKQRICNLFR